MANWKKMAEAFGRAMNERMKDGKTAKIINSSEIADKANTPGIYKDKDMDAIQAYRRGQNEGTENFYIGRERATDNAINNMDPTAKRIYDNYDFDYERAYGPDGAYRRAVELSGVEDAPSSPFEFEERFGFDISKSPSPRKSDVSRSISSVEDEHSSMRLQDEFNKAFDEAAENHGYNKWRNESKDMPVNDGFGGSLHDVNREDAVQRSREEIIKALQQNTDRDVTDVLRDFGYIFEE